MQTDVETGVEGTVVHGRDAPELQVQAVHFLTTLFAENPLCIPSSFRYI